jgi:cytochrome c oxidase assembly protein subunit 15
MPGLTRFAALLLLLVFVMVLSGALVAGLHAGRVYNTFPLMLGYWVPPDILILEPPWINVFNNLATVQFDHRMLAWALLLLVPLLWWRIRDGIAAPAPRRAANAMLAMLLLQVAMGIATLLLLVPVALAAAHQAGAMLLLATVLWTNHELRVGSD